MKRYALIGGTVIVTVLLTSRVLDSLALPVSSVTSDDDNDHHHDNYDNDDVDDYDNDYDILTEQLH